MQLNRKIYVIFAEDYGLRGRSHNLGTTGFDSRQSLIVSTPSVVRRLVKVNVRQSNGNNSYALAA